MILCGDSLALTRVTKSRDCITNKNTRLEHSPAGRIEPRRMTKLLFRNGSWRLILFVWEREKQLRNRRKAEYQILLYCTTTAKYNQGNEEKI